MIFEISNLRFPTIAKRAYALLILLASAVLPVHASMTTIDSRSHHLGVAGKPEWDIFEGHTPEAESLHLTFDAHANAREYTLFIRQDDVKQDWTVTLNGQKLGQLFLMEADLIHTLPIPVHALRDGPNELLISTKTPEDILIHSLFIGDDTKEKLLSAGPVNVAVQDRASGEPLPCRLTILDQHNSLTPVYDFGSTNLATRPGVIYTANGSARFKLLPGLYTIYATRGPEYTVASIHDFDPSDPEPLQLKLERAANTRGWVATDTHIHTFSLSRHGDATLAERLITIAGEGIKLAISTEHNLHADYFPLAQSMGLTKYFTILPGNEVTTKKGHFNIFPVDLTANPPNANLENWPALLKLIRATPRVEVAILNHPTDTHNNFTPFAATNLNLVTGRPLATNIDLSFDAMEVINSGAMRSDWTEPFRAWFALLNRGYKITGIGASDSHDVSRYIGGQGRTYIRVHDSDVGHIDIAEACAALKAGHATISLGLIPHLVIRDPSMPEKSAEPGDLISIKGSTIEAKMSVDSPLLGVSQPSFGMYPNGLRLGGMMWDATGHYGNMDRSFPKPAHDTFYVLIVTIFGNAAPEWTLARPYQPASTHWTAQLIGATNPIWVDADGDGKFTSAHEYASALIEKFAKDLPKLFSELVTYDYYVAAHCAELLAASGHDLKASDLTSALANASPETKRAFADYQTASQGIAPQSQPLP